MDHNKSRCVLTNTSISDTCHAKDVVSRRFSIGLSGQSAHHVTKSIFDDSLGYDRVQPMRSSFDLDYYKKLESRGDSKKRRDPFDLKSPLSPLKVSTNFFEDIHPPAVRRSSIDSVETFASESVCENDDCISMDDAHEEMSPSEAYQTNRGSNEGEETTAAVCDSTPANFQPSKTVLPFLPILPSSELKGAIEKFTSSMSKSIASQQAIHDWDRKMGLKRSHSKTMRLSMRSRKRLKIMLKKDMKSKSILK